MPGGGKGREGKRKRCTKIGQLLLRLHSPDEFTGRIFAPHGLSETALRAGHIPSAANIPWSQAVNEERTFKIAGRLKLLYESAGIDGRRSHDCRRVFASEHLNNNTPVRIIQALLGHASLGAVMICARLYASRLVEEHRKTVRGLYNTHYGEEGLKNPTAEEWAAFAASCNLRDMGTHLCALPTGEHCPRGLICLGCADAQPKRSAVPIFRRMFASHQCSLSAARDHNEPAGQIAARELEIVRIKRAL